MGTSYSCPQLTTDAQRLAYLHDQGICLDQASHLIKLSNLEPFEEFQQVIGVLYPLKSRYIDESFTLKNSCEKLKIWCQMREWTKDRYLELNKKWTQEFNQQMKIRRQEVTAEISKTLSQIREYIHGCLVSWVDRKQITPYTHKLEHNKIKKESADPDYSCHTLKPYKMPSEYGKEYKYSSEPKILGYDWRLVWNALDKPITYTVPVDHHTMGGFQVKFTRDLLTFSMAGSCMSYGGDDWGGISNEERNRREAAKPTQYFFNYSFLIEVVKY